MIALRTESRAVRGRAGRLLAVGAVALAIGASAGTGLGLGLGLANARTFEEVDVEAACEDGSAYTSYHDVDRTTTPLRGVAFSRPQRPRPAARGRTREGRASPAPPSKNRVRRDVTDYPVFARAHRLGRQRLPYAPTPTRLSAALPGPYTGQPAVETGVCLR